MSLRHARRTIGLLVACQGLLGTNNVLNIGVTGLAGYALAPDKAWATLPLTAYVVGAALSTLPASFWMKKVGRRMGFVTGAAMGSCGSAINALAMIDHRFGLLIAGTFLAGGYNAFGQYYRFAAAEAVDEGWKAKAIAYVLLGSIAGAIFGPEVSKHAINAFAVPFLGVYVFLAGCALTALALQLLVPLTVAPSPVETGGTARPLLAIVAQPRYIVAVMSSVVGYATMNFLMTSTPLAMMAMHHSYDSTATVIEWHTLGMFAPSFVTGTLIRRAGIFAVMAMGTLLMLTAVAVAEWNTGVLYFWIALVCVGVAWNFLYVSGTALLTSCYRLSERAQAQGVNDMLVFASTGTASLMSGVLLHQWGWHNMVLATLPLLLMMLATLSWARSAIDLRAAPAGGAG